MNKNIKTALFTITTAFLFFFTGCNGVNNSTPSQEDKAIISFAARDAGVGDSQVTTGKALDLNEMDQIILYYGSKGAAQAFMENKTWETQGSTSAYAKFKEASMELEYGHYHFILEVYKDGEQYLSGEITDFEVTKDTTTITFETSIIYTDNSTQRDLKLYFVDNTSTLSKINVKLYSSLESLDSSTLIDSRDISLTDVTGFTNQVFAFEKSGITYAQCYLVYKVYTKVQDGYEVDEWGDTIYETDDNGNYIYDMSGMPIPIPRYSYVYLNTIGPEIVEMNETITQGVITIQDGDINTLPQDAKLSGTFIPFNPSITFEVLEKSEKFYLNTGILKIKIVNDYGDSYGEHQTKAKLLYNGVETGSHPSYTTTTSGSNVTVKFELSNDKRLPLGGHYQLFIQVPQEFQVGENEITMFASKTFDIDVINKEYYEFDVGNYMRMNAGTPASAVLAEQMKKAFEKIGNDAEIRIFGNPSDADDPEDYYGNISSALSIVENYNIDLDMSEVGKLEQLETMTHIFTIPKAVRSIKLPAKLYSIPRMSLEASNNLQTVYIYEDGGNQENGGRNIGYQALNFPNVQEFIVVNAPGVTSDYSTLENGKLLLKTLRDQQGSPTGSEILAASPSITSLDLTNKGVLSIGDYVFANSDIETITGFDSIMNIGQYAFYKAEHLEFLNMASILQIGSAAFMDSGLELISAWNSEPKSIGVSAFENTKLSNVPILRATDTVSSNAFKGLKNIETFEIDEEFINFIKAKGTDIIFDNCKAEYFVIDYPLDLGEGVKTLFNKSDDDYVILKSYTERFEITDTLSFEQNITLKDLSDKDSGLFSDYISSIKNIEFKGKSIIGAHSFDGAMKLESVTFADTSNASEIGEYAFYATDQVWQYDQIVSRSASNIDLTGVKKICSYAFQYWQDANQTLTIPSSVVAIQAEAFDNFRQATPVTFATTVNWLAVTGYDETVPTSLNPAKATAQIEAWLSGAQTCTGAEKIGENDNPKIYTLGSGHNISMMELSGAYFKPEGVDSGYDENDPDKIIDRHWFYRYTAH